MGKKKAAIRSMGDASISEMVKKGQGYYNPGKKSDGEWSGPDLEANERLKPGKGFKR